MKISDLPISPVLMEFYLNDGIITLHPPQVDVINHGLFENKNMLISIPTASGKTLMAELAMLKSIVENFGKVLYIVPLKALASEKYARFSKFEELNFGNGMTIKTIQSTSDFKSKGDVLGESDIIVVTSEKADSLIRNKASWIKDISLVVIDEIHLIGDKERGATLEMIIAKMKRINPNIQIIGLSATIGNPQSVAEWLKAELVVSDWRPIQLKEGVFHDNKIEFDNDSRPVKCQSVEDINSLVIDMVLEGGQCLVFCSSRRIAESKAKKIATELVRHISKENMTALEHISSKISDKSDSKTTTVLANCVSFGAAFHHAGLIDAHRTLIESGFRDGKIKVIFCTPTLAAGLNLPARRVIVQGYTRYVLPSGIIEDISVIEYKQMAGRAGRPRLDPYGECILIPSQGKSPEQEVDRMFSDFIHGTPEDIYSQFMNEKHLRIHILASIASGFTTSISEVIALLYETFLPYRMSDPIFPLSSESINKTILDAIEDLIFDAMIIQDVRGSLSATPLGVIISRLCLDPKTGALIMHGFREIESSNLRLTDMTLLHLLAMTDDMGSLRYYRDRDDAMVMQIFNGQEEELIKFKNLILPKKKKMDFNEVIAPLKVAEILRTWVTEVKESTIAEEWKLGEGDVHTIIESSKRIASAIVEIGVLHQNEQITKTARVLRVRIDKGIRQELIGLTKIKGIGRVFARRLYNAGINSVQKYDALNKTHPEQIHAIKYPTGEQKKDIKPIPKPAAVIPVPPTTKQPKPVRATGQKSFADY